MGVTNQPIWIRSRPRENEHVEERWWYCAVCAQAKAEDVHKNIRLVFGGHKPTKHCIVRRRVAAVPIIGFGHDMTHANILLGQGSVAVSMSCAPRSVHVKRDHLAQYPSGGGGWNGDLFSRACACASHWYIISKFEQHSSPAHAKSHGTAYSSLMTRAVCRCRNKQRAEKKEKKRNHEKERISKKRDDPQTNFHKQ